MSIHIYVEGGSNGILKTYCRQAFKSFIGKVIPEDSFSVTACGDRRRTFEAFKLAIVSRPDDFVVLLVDSEDEVTLDVWAHLGARTGDRWVRPAGISDNQVHLMVRVMESWFLADPDFLGQYFGTDFRRTALPRRNDLEQVPKLQVYESLNSAAYDTKKKLYHKTRDGFSILAGISPSLVRASFPHARHFLESLESKAAPPPKRR